MSVSYVRLYLLLALFLSFIFKESDAWIGSKEDQRPLFVLCRQIVYDAVRKGQAVWPYRRVYQRYVSYAMGERVYIIRAKFAEMLRDYLRNQFRQNKYSVSAMVRNAVRLQGKAQMMYLFRDDLLEMDKEVHTAANYLKKPRFGDHNCQIAGPPCHIDPEKVSGRGRRSFTSKTSGSMEEALKLMDARREFIKNKYKPDKFPQPIDINGSLSIKFTTLSGSSDMETEFVDLAPDFID